MTSCEAAVILASALDQDQDRLAAFCTNSNNFQISDREPILPLSKVNLRRTKKAVDLITCTSDKSSLSTVIESATAHLLQSTAAYQHESTKRSTTGHVFVFASSFDTVALDVLEHPEFQVHLVCTSALCCTDHDQQASNGWRVCSRYSHCEAPKSLSIVRKGGELQQQLMMVVQHIRFGQCHGQLTDLVVDFEAGAHCSIEGLMGKKSFSSLQPGETISALVKVKIGALPSRKSVLSKLQQSFKTTTGSNDLLKELNALLNETDVAILSAKLKYRHPALSYNTECSIKAEARLKRRTSETEIKRRRPDMESPTTSNQKAIVQSQLINYIGTQHSPRQALKTLAQHYGDSGRASVIPEYYKIVEDELKYRARVAERSSLSTSGSSEIYQATIEEKKIGSHFGQNLDDVSNYKPQDWIMVADSNENRRPQITRSPDKSGLVSSKLSLEGSMDDARQIWGDLKKRSNPPLTKLPTKQWQNANRRGGGMGKLFPSNESSGDGANMDRVRSSEEEKLTLQHPTYQQLQELALRNKRSVGQDTLRSIANGNESRREGGPFAPWM